MEETNVQKNVKTRDTNAICFFMNFRTISIKSTLVNRFISFISPSFKICFTN